MPPARPATAATRRSAASSARRATSSPRPRRQSRPAPRLVVRPPRLRVRWERVGRVGLLCVFAVVAGLYVQHTLSYLATHSQADQQAAIVDKLQRQNAALTRQAQALNNPQTIVQDARVLGMVRQGERPYVITGMASH